VIKKVKVNFPHEGKPAGHIWNIEFTGLVPAEKFWRRRWEDSKRDKCMELVVANKKGVDK
jgi:hypothetical protein